MHELYFMVTHSCLGLSFMLILLYLLMQLYLDTKCGCVQMTVHMSFVLIRGPAHHSHAPVVHSHLFIQQCPRSPIAWATSGIFTKTYSRSAWRTLFKQWWASGQP